MSFEEIAKESTALRLVLEQVQTVAPTLSTVLICGETGTGKGLVARTIHKLSPRAASAFVKFNCVSIPADLLESELFGHEKGALAGAMAKRIGRLEMARHGDLFFEEFSEIPLEFQTKLLRVMQEGEFERLGSPRTLKSDARFIVSTTRDLQGMVADHKFRADLFYCLNVFPIYLPPLRERQDDIPSLARHFVEQFALRMNKTIDTIPCEIIDALRAYQWPGNMYELRNIIERAVILSTGPVLDIPLENLKPMFSRNGRGKNEVSIEVQRQRILTTLEETGWILGGKNGAAARLGMKRPVLQSCIRKLGIVRLSGR